MTNVEVAKRLLAQLRTATGDPVPLLNQLVSSWNDGFEREMVEVLKGNAIFSVVAKVMNNRTREYFKHIPDWVVGLMSRSYEYVDEHDVFAHDQIKQLVGTFRKYVIGGCWEIMYCFFLLTGFKHTKQILLEDEELYNFIKTGLEKPHVIAYFGNCAGRGFDPWKRKMMVDTEFILKALDLNSWNLFRNLALHPDAKFLMPPEVVAKAGKSKEVVCVTIYALLCSDNDLELYELDSTYIDVQLGLLATLLQTGSASHDNIQQGLYNILPSIANLSASDSCKEKLGAKAVKLLLSVITDELPDTPLIRTDFAKCRNIAAKSLWNLAYLHSNCARIRAENGIERLEKTMAAVDDFDLKKNIEGILHICNPKKESPKNIANASKEGGITASSSTSKHVMISYNWDNQPIVKRIAQSLKDQGYKVWLDLEQMGGSTLEAMATAIEHSELVLVCMSQKYKDSPNCRLEGEYCVNKRVAFVPLMMQKGYAPDGWLGIALGAKLWYDFTSDTDWDSKIGALTKAIGARGKAPNSAPNSNSASIPEAHPTPTLKVEGNKIEDWTPEEMLKWMKSSKIEQAEDYFALLRKHKVNGNALLELKHLLVNPLSFGNFQTVCEKMGIEEVGIVLQLAAAIRKL